MHLSGVAVRTDQVQLLVGLLNADELAAKFRLNTLVRAAPEFIIGVV